MKPPRLAPGHPDRLLELEEQIEATLNFLMDDLVSVGCGVEEAQQAVRNIADIFKTRHDAMQDTERQVAEARRTRAH